MTTFRVGAATDTGRVRNMNQDSFLVRDNLFAVADGMGGHQGGEVASEMAVETLSQLTLDPTADNLLTGVHEANHVIFERSRKDPDLRGMGTTLCAVALVAEDGDEELAIVNVGDSRVYLFRDDELTQLTRDHNLVEDMRQEGRITDEEAAVHPQRNIVTRALGIAPRVDVDEFSVIPHSGDKLILCSDGLFNEVPPDRIAATLRRLADPDEASHELVRLANEGGGRDNITCVLVEVVDDDGRAERAAQSGVELVRARPKRAPDLAGFATAGELELEEGATGGRGRRLTRRLLDDGERLPRVLRKRDHESSDADRPGAHAPPPEAPEAPPPVRAKAFTWRTALFLLLFAGVLAAVVATLGWYGRGAYYVGYDGGDTVTIYQGRPNGFLWFQPTFVESTGVARSQVPGMFVDALESGRVWSSRHDAEAYVDNIRAVICEQATTTKPATTTTLASKAAGPTTTLPASCRSTTTTTPPTTVSPPTTRRTTTTARHTATTKP